MKTTAIRIHGKKDIRLDSFDLPVLQNDEILAKVVCDSVCFSTYKAWTLGPEHVRIPHDVSVNPTMLGHEFCGKIVQVGKKWQKDFSVGQKFTIQPALPLPDSIDAPGYSFSYIGGDATYIIIPNIVIEKNCLLPFEGDAYFMGAMGEPFSCVIGACNCMYHVSPASYHHVMGIQQGGAMAILGGTGPMGYACIDYCLHGKYAPKLLVVVGRNKEKLERAKQLYTVAQAKKKGIQLQYVHAETEQEILSQLLAMCPTKYNDIIVMVSSQVLLRTADSLLAKDGCLNFFAGPADTQFSSPINFYRVHYDLTHIASNSGGTIDDMKEALSLIAEKRLNPSALITHIGGLSCVVDTIQQFPTLSGAKKLIYTHKRLPLIALDTLRKKIIDTSIQTQSDVSPEFFKDLSAIVEKNNGEWSSEAEQYLLAEAPDV